MQVPFNEWIEIMVQAENLVRIRRRGFCYIDAEKVPVAQMLTDKIGIDMMDWINTYFDYDYYN